MKILKIKLRNFYKIVRSNPEYLLLILILIFSALIRFYKLGEMTNFDYDQEYASNFAYSVIREYPIQLIGQGLSVMGLFMGPLYFYYLTPFYFIFGLHPIGGAVASAFLGLLTIAAYFFVLRDVFDVKTGLIAAFFRGFLMAKINADWSITPAFSADLVVLFTFYLMYKFFKNGDRWLIPLAFVFGLYTSMHPILFPFYFVFTALFLLLKKTMPPVKIIIKSVFAFIFPITPLILFEYFHKFEEIKRLFSFTSGEPAEIRNLEKLLYLLKANDFYFSFTFTPILDRDTLLISLVLICLVLIIIVKGRLWKNSVHKLMLPVTFIISLLYYFLLPSHSPEYYFIGTETIFLIYFFYGLGKMKLKYLLPLLFLVIIYNFNILRTRWLRDDLTTIYYKDQVVKKILSIQPEQQEFFVSYISEPGWHWGFDYFFKLYDQIPQTKEVKDPIYTIVVPKKLVSDDFDYESGNIRVILPE